MLLNLPLLGCDLSWESYVQDWRFSDLPLVVNGGAVRLVVYRRWLPVWPRRPGLGVVLLRGDHQKKKEQARNFCFFRKESKP